MFGFNYLSALNNLIWQFDETNKEMVESLLNVTFRKSQEKNVFTVQTFDTNIWDTCYLLTGIDFDLYKRGDQYKIILKL